MFPRLETNESEPEPEPKREGTRNIKRLFQGLQTLYQAHLSEVDPRLINDLLVREQQNERSPDHSA
jgi:hypothetical protein